MAYTPVRPDPIYSGTIDTLLMILNTRLAIYSQMSNGLFKGSTVDPQGCMCSEIQLLQTILNNDVSFYYWQSAQGGGGEFSRVDPTIRSFADLAAVPTAGVSNPQVKVWVDSATGSEQCWVMLQGVDATNTGQGIQRANDWAATGNVWYRAGA